MILSQLMDAGELSQLTPASLRELIMKLDDQIKFGASSGEQLLFSIEANIVGVKADKPAGANYAVTTTKAGTPALRKEPATRSRTSTKKPTKGSK